MKRFVGTALWGLALWLTFASAAGAQSRLHIGYVYPAGGRQGSTVEVVVGGQSLTGVNNVFFTGEGVQARITGLVQPISNKELNQLRIRVDELLARRAVVRQDFRALENFRSLKNAKSAKQDDATHDRELEELKKKYAGATWTDADERELTEIRKKAGSAVRRPANPAICELAVLEVTVAPDAAPGPRELRIAAPGGLSNPIAFWVGQLPEASEPASKTITQQKSSIAKTAFAPKKRKAEPTPEITLPCTVNGQILPGEVDRFRFQAHRGQRLVLVACARQLIPYIPDAVPGWFQATLGVYDAQGKELAYDDDYRFNPDPVLFCRIPADGEYTVEIKDAIYRGREDFLYRVTIGELPFVTNSFPLGGPAGAETTVTLKGWNLPTNKLVMDARHREPGIYPLSVRKAGHESNIVPFAVDNLPECLEQEPNNTPDTAQAIPVPMIVNGRIGQPGDSDVFRLEAKAGTQLVAEVRARRLNSPLDSVLKLTDATGRQVAMNDDCEDRSAGLTTHHADSYLLLTIPADGVYYLHLSDMQHQGGSEYAYRLRISPPRPDFELRVVPASISARYTGIVPVTVYALRKDGFAGDIALALKDAPQGFAIDGGCVPGGQDRMRVTLSIAAEGQEKPVPVRLEGRATIGGREVCRVATPAEDMMQAFEYRHLVPVQELNVAVAGRVQGKRSLRILGEMPVKIPAGGTARIQVGTTFNKFLDRRQLELSDAPEGIAIASVAPTREGVEIVLRSEAGKAKPGLKGNLIVTVSAQKPAENAKGKQASAQRGTPVATLPAVPFEVIGP
jgi:hypothetical protein